MKRLAGLCLSVALSSLVLPARAGEPSNVMTWIEEDASCAHADTAPAAQPKVRHRKIPAVPREAAIRARDGFVVFALTVDTDGNVSAIQQTADALHDPDLNASLAKTFQQWTFLAGKPGQYCLDASVDFEPIVDPRINPHNPKAPKPSMAEPLAYPAEAFDAHIGGKLVLNVRIVGDGSVGAVQPIAETPSGQGFAAMAAEGVHRWTFAGSTPGWHQLDVTFKPPATAPTP